MVWRARVRVLEAKKHVSARHTCGPGSACGVTAACRAWCLTAELLMRSLCPGAVTTERCAQATLAQTKKALEDERKRSATWQEECNSILAKYGSDDQKALQEARTRCDSLQKEVDTLTRTAEASAKERSQLQKVTRPSFPLTPGRLSFVY